MTAAVATVKSAHEDLLASYGKFVDGLAVGKGQRWARRRAARNFLAEHPDLGAWMSLPTRTRLRDLHRFKA